MVSRGAQQHHDWNVVGIHYMVAIDNAIIINCVSVIPIMLVGFVFFMLWEGTLAFKGSLN